MTGAPIATQQLETQTFSIYGNQSNSQSARQGSVCKYTFRPNHADTPGRTQAFDTKIFKVALLEREKAFNTWRQAAAPNMEEGDRALLSKLVSASGQKQKIATENFSTALAGAMELTAAVKLVVQKYGANVHELTHQFGMSDDIRRELQHLSVSGMAGEAAQHAARADKPDLKQLAAIVRDYGLYSDDISEDSSITPAERISSIYEIALAHKENNPL